MKKRKREEDDESELEPKRKKQKTLVESVLNKGEVLINEGKYEKAIETMNTIFMDDSEMGRFYYYRGCCFFELGENFRQRMMNCLSKEYVKRAISSFNEAIILNQNKDEYYFARGKCFGFSFDQEKAINDFTEAIRLNKNNPEYYFERAKCYYWVEEEEKAISDYFEAIQLDGNNPKYYVQRACDYSELNEFEKSINDFNEAIKIDPENLEDYHYKRADLFLSFDEDVYSTSDIIKDFTIALLKYNTYHDRGLMFHEVGQYEKACDDFSTVIFQLHEKKSSNYHVTQSRLYKALCLTEMKDFSNALFNFRQRRMNNLSYQECVNGVTKTQVYLLDQKLFISKFA